MKIGKKILGEAAVLLIAAFLILSTSAVVANTSEDTLSTCGCIVPGVFEPLPLSLDEETLGFYDPATMPSVCVGLTSTPPNPPYYWKTAIRLTQDELAQYAGWNITGVNAFQCFGEALEHEGDIIIYGEGSPTQPGAIITTEPYYFDSQNWFRIDLTTPVPIDEHNEIWVAIDWETGDPDHPAAMDGIEAVDGKGDWIYMNAIWQESQTFGANFDHNWGIEAIVEGTGTIWTELSITVPTGPIGVSTGIKNIGENPATNVVYEFTVIGGIFGMINKNITGTVTELAIGGEESLSSGLILGLGSVDISVSADADNADPVSKSYTALVLGPFVLRIE
jgi:hypothetical protein